MPLWHWWGGRQVPRLTWGSGLGTLTSHLRLLLSLLPIVVLRHQKTPEVTESVSLWQVGLLSLLPIVFQPQWLSKLSHFLLLPHLTAAVHFTFFSDTKYSQFPILFLFSDSCSWVTRYWNYPQWSQDEQPFSCNDEISMIHTNANSRYQDLRLTSAINYWYWNRPEVLILFPIQGVSYVSDAGNTKVTAQKTLQYMASTLLTCY